MWFSSPCIDASKLSLVKEILLYFLDSYSLCHIFDEISTTGFGFEKLYRLFKVNFSYFSFISAYSQVFMVIIIIIIAIDGYGSSSFSSMK